MKYLFITFVALVVIAAGVYVYTSNNLTIFTPTEKSNPNQPSTPEPTTAAQPTDTSSASTTDTEVVEESEVVIGKSVNGADITAYHFGTGDTELLFIGGTHGGYSWNTSAVAYELIDYLEADPSIIPANLKVTVIPVLNPDGLKIVTGSTGRFSSSDVNTDNTTRVTGRFNANTVDLNRNFDCEWKENSTWLSQTVSGGTRAFSEPESQAIRDYVKNRNIAGTVVWFSAEGKVYTAACGGAPSAETKSLATTFGAAAEYGVDQTFDTYELNGDMTNWLAKENIPTISVLLTSHQDVEWSKNKAGVVAVLNAYKE